MRLALAAITLACAGHVSAQDIVLTSPLTCDLGTTCFIQQYVDRDPDKGVVDYRCAGLSYDGHKGTDFALPSLAMMRDGVPVLAVADGVVKGLRDEMPDTGLTPQTADAIKGRECGNGVRIDHEGGWTTQYCHLKQGSITVRAGQNVSAGDPLGEVGKSGSSEFPHLHLSVRKDGAPVDPFDPDPVLACDVDDNDSLWAITPTYRPGGLIALGFSDAIPKYAAIKEGSAGKDTLSPDAPALVLWGYTFGTRKDDILRLSLDGPAGEVISKDIVMEKPQAQSFRAIGKRRSADWPLGRYTGTVILIRDGKTVEMRRAQLMLQ